MKYSQLIFQGSAAEIWPHLSPDRHFYSFDFVIMSGLSALLF